MPQPVAAAVGVLTTMTAAAVLVAPAVENRMVYGTFQSQGPPPRVDYCGRRYYPADTGELQTLGEVDASLAGNGLFGLTRIGTAPSGMPVLTNVLSNAARGQRGTSVCTMELWVKTGADAYLPYTLSGGP